MTHDVRAVVQMEGSANYEAFVQCRDCGKTAIWWFYCALHIDDLAKERGMINEVVANLD
jgi:hypothetical protein